MQVLVCGPSNNITLPDIWLVWFDVLSSADMFCLVLRLTFSLFLPCPSRLLRLTGDVADTTCRGFSVAQKIVKGFTVSSMTMTRSSVALGTIPSRFVCLKFKTCGTVLLFSFPLHSSTHWPLSWPFRFKVNSELCRVDILADTVTFSLIKDSLFDNVSYNFLI